MATIGLCAVFCGPLALRISAEPADVLPSVSERYADSQASERPDFQRHVVPLLGRLGCNGRACHGSFQGRGGFRLSLFGYDFRMDHDGLTGKATSHRGARIDRERADQSLVITKPSMQEAHEGGERFQIGSWEHHILRNWIQSGAPGAQGIRELDRLEADPEEIVFEHGGDQTAQLQITAVWKDGQREDVTPLCRFRTNDDSVATVDENGVIASEGAGDTHVIAFYDNGVVAVPALRAFRRPGDQSFPNVRGRTEIDRHVLAKLRKLNLIPSAICSDEEFLRRVSIDLCGTLPVPAEIESFVADTSPDKRQQKIDELLDRPSYAAWWANKLCDFTGCNPRQQAELGQDTSVQWYMWILKRIEDNVSYDELIRRIVLALGRSDRQTYDEYAAEMSGYFREDSPAEFSDRATMPHFWSRRTLSEPDDKALAFAHSFLGIRLQCAQCHKHPFAPWTQADFRQFSQFFENVRFGVEPSADRRYREIAKQVGQPVRGQDGSPIRPEVLKHARAGRTIPWREVYVAQRSEPVSLSLLRSGTVDLAVQQDPREAIMTWMEQPQNPWFATAFVNRVWAGYFNVGIIDPPDDLNAANPPGHPALLAWLTNAFVDHKYDMKWLHRTIVSSDTYQRSWRPTANNADDTRNFSRAVPRRIPAEVVYDGVKQALAATDRQSLVRTDLTRRAIGHLSMRLAGTYAMHVFGKPERAVNCDCERVNHPTLLQSVFMQNDPLIDQRLENSGWIAEISARDTGDLDMDVLIRDSWLRTVGRSPRPEELSRARRHIRESESAAEGIRDLLWALINTKEFILNH